MKIVIAPDKFKGSLTARKVAMALAFGLQEAKLPKVKIDIVPMADGGDGTVDVLVNATGGRIVEQVATDPLGRLIVTEFGVLGDNKTAVIEMAKASGLDLVWQPKVGVDDRNPLITTTYGTGELIKAAMREGCTKFIIGIGGSATNDGGAGMAKALGAHLLDKKGRELEPGGGALDKLMEIDVFSLNKQVIRKLNVKVACDVKNPLCGPNGASMVYGRQKCPERWSEEEKLTVLKKLDSNLVHYAKIIKTTRGITNKNVQNCKGAGAAGGLGAGLMAFLNASLKSGGDLVAGYVELENHLRNADLVITGEGGTDSSTKFNKVPVVVARYAKNHKLPVICVSGTVMSDGYEIHKYGIDVLLSITPRPMRLEECITNTAELLRRTGEEIGRMLAIGER